jgi:hypothetical protein
MVAVPAGSKTLAEQTQFWSGSENGCTVPNCTSASITVTVPVTIMVQDTDNATKTGLNV